MHTEQITLEKLKEWEACYWRIDGDKNLAEYVESKLPLDTIDVLDLDIPSKDILWCLLRTEIFTERQLNLIICDFAESVLPLFEREFKNDDRPRKAIEIKRLWVDGKASDHKLAAARADAIDAVWVAARIAARAIDAVWVTDSATARAAGVAARIAARATDMAANSAAARAADAVLDAARVIDKEKQLKILRKYLLEKN